MLLLIAAHCLHLLIQWIDSLLDYLLYLQRWLVVKAEASAIRLQKEQTFARLAPDSAMEDESGSESMATVESLSPDTSVAGSAASSPDFQIYALPSTTEGNTEARRGPNLVSGASQIRTFALVIAIDEYHHQSFKKLSGCVLDAQDFTKFLISTRGVPEQHIYTLTNGQATRIAILNAIKDLIANPSIKKDDLIFFYYAGHGSRRSAPKGWVPDGRKIEMICPCDERMPSDGGGKVEGIPDLTFDALMRKLAHAKGDNIIAIFDCCHSGGMGRQGLDGTPRALSDEHTHIPLPATLDEDIRIWCDDVKPTGRGAELRTPTGFLWPAMHSHILLAACRVDETAIENRVTLSSKGSITVTRGLFTLHLLTFLRKAHTDQKLLAQLTYADLPGRLEKESPDTAKLYGRALLDKQHPVCEGQNRDRLLFSLTSGGQGEPSYAVVRSGGKIWVEAGSSVGIRKGTRFAVNTATGADGAPRKGGVTVLQADDVQSDLCRCTVMQDTDNPPAHLTEGIRATVVRWSPEAMRVWAPGLRLPVGTAVPFAFSLVSDKQKCDISLELDKVKTRWVLTRFDPLTIQYASSKSLSLDANVTRATDILEHVAHWNFHMYRTSDASKTDSLRQQLRVKVELHRLEEAGHVDSIRSLLVPHGVDLLKGATQMSLARDSTSLYALEDPVMEATIQDLKPYYGLKVKNESDHALFVYVFYFDPNHCGIQKWYPPDGYSAKDWQPLAKKAREGNVLTIGYGDGGTDPIEFSIKHGDRDTGFLKIFLSMSQVDMEFIRQAPLTEQRPARVVGPRARPMSPKWNSLMYALTCVR